MPELVEEYMCWLKEMHEEYDEEVEFLDQGTYIIGHPRLEELGLNKDSTNLAIMFFKHMKDDKGEWNAGGLMPIRIKLQKGAFKGLKNDLYATIEWFYFHGTGEEHGEVRMICRPIDIAEEEGSKMKTSRGDIIFLLNKSIPISVTTLTNSDKCKRLSPDEWQKKENELSSKVPAKIDVLNEADSKTFQCDKAFPSKLQAGSELPPQFLAVVRPKQGTGASCKQGMIVAEALEIRLQVTFSPVQIITEPFPTKTRSIVTKSGGNEVICEVMVKGGDVINGVKGLYLFDTKVLGLEGKLVKQGTYTFIWSMVTPKYESVAPAVRKVNVSAATQTKRWTICNHMGSCAAEHPDNPICITTRLKKQLVDDLYLAKFDAFGNQQVFGRMLPSLEVSAQTPDGRTVLKGCTIGSDTLKLSENKLHVCIQKKVLFSKGNLDPIAPSYDAELLFVIKDKSIGETKPVMTEFPKLKCQVYPGELVSFTIKTSPPLETGPPLCFTDPFQPNDVIEALSIQGKDEFGNNVEKGPKVRVAMDGLAFQDKNGPIREVNKHGCVELGGLLRVTASYNCTGSITFSSESQICGRQSLEICFKVVDRHLQFGLEVPTNWLVASTVDGILLEVVDSAGVVDTRVDGPYHTLTLNWMKNIICPIVKGRCELPSFELPGRQGLWVGTVSHSTFDSMKLELKLQLGLGSAHHLALPAEEQDLNVQCGESKVVKFTALDARGQPARLSEDMIKNLEVDIQPELELEKSAQVAKLLNDIEINELNSNPIHYAVSLLIGGQVGAYKILLKDSSGTLQQQPGSTAILTWRVNLEHGRLARIKPVVLTSTSNNWPTLSESDAVLLETATMSLIVAQLSMFPAIQIHMLDTYNNLCPYYDRQILDLVLVPEDCKDSRADTQKHQCEISNGIGLFMPFKLEVKAGRYDVMVHISSMVFRKGFPRPAEAHMSLDVLPGNYPSAMRFLDVCSSTMECTPDMQVLPEIIVEVVSADGKPVQGLTSPVMILQSDGMEPSQNKEYHGEPLETKPILEAISGAMAPMHFRFSHIYVPPSAGVYSLQVFLPGYDIPSLSHELDVRHGRPTEMQVSLEGPGKTGQVVEVKVVDAHGNVCSAVSDLSLSLDLEASDEDSECSVLAGGVVRSCVLMSNKFANLKNGLARFQELQLSAGKPGPYILTVSVVEEECPAFSLPSTRTQMMVIHGHTEQRLQEEMTALASKIKETKMEQAHLRRSKVVLEKEIAHQKDVTEELLREQDMIQRRCVEAQDQIILSREHNQPVRTDQHVRAELRQHGGHLAARVFQELCDRDRHGSASFLKGEGIGVPATLARVENQDLNTTLSEYIGVKSLLTLVCKTQRGVSSLEVKDAHGNVDQRVGIHAAASPLQIRGRFEALALEDLQPFSGGVIRNHPQLLLDMRPVESTGFLGFAANLLHMNEEQLSIRVTLRSKGDQQFGLRETLFYDLFRHLQVYDTKENMLQAKQRHLLQSGAVSLDGGVITSNMRQRLGPRRASPVSFALVSYEERCATSGLIPPTSDAFERRQALQKVRSSVERHKQQLAQREDELLKKTHEIAALEKSLREHEIKERNLFAAARNQQEDNAIHNNDKLYIYM
ncbi:hypothetical protein BDL97_12G015300 [Sphagnum fallax]|nr:hypothetical protein BDL97_12G015300 [Sphagnum fallax]